MAWTSIEYNQYIYKIYQSIEIRACANNRQIDSSGPGRSSDVFVFVKYFKLTLQQDILQ